MRQQATWVSQEVRPDPIIKVAAQVGMTRAQFDSCRENRGMIQARARSQQAVSALRTALGEFTRTGDPHGRFLAHYWLSIAYDDLGDRERARFEAQSAAHFSGFVDKRSCPEARDMRALRALGRFDDA